MKRDMMKTVSEVKGRIPRAYGLGFNECLELTKQAAGGDANAAFEAINTAFEYGFVLGARCEKKNPGTVTGAKK